MSSRSDTVLLTLLVAAAYCVTGKLALLLAIPPGYATAVWPPAGIALAAFLLYGRRIWAGVLLGSLIANLATSFDATSMGTMLRSTAIAFVIGSGAALQAFVGSWLIERFAPKSRELTNERQVFSFFALSALGCFVNASIGVATLVLTQTVPLGAAGFSWWTWWVGDSIGVLIFTPLILMWLDEQAQWQQRRLAVTIPLLTMLCAAVLVFVYASRTESREQRANFADLAGRISSDLERRLALDSATLRAISGLFAVNERVEPEQFDRLARLLMPAHPEMRALTWAPRVTAADRAKFEASQRERGIAAGIVQFREGALEPASQRKQYFPIVTMAGEYALETSFGFDLGSEPGPRAAIEGAVASGRVTATPVMTIREAGSTVAGVAITVPVYSDVDSPLPVAHRVDGVLLGTLRVDELIAQALTNEGADRALLIIEDVTDGDSKQTLYRSDGLSAQQPLATRAALDLVTTQALSFGGREWFITFTPTLDYMTNHRSFVAWLVLACGLAISALVGAGALILTGRTKEIAGLVHVRTEELALINEKLADEICDHINTENKLNSEREFLRTILENLNEGILVYDEQGELTMANRSAREAHARLFGEAQVAGTWTNQYRLFESDGRTPIPPNAHPRIRALRGETVRELEVVAVAGNGQPADLMLTAQPLLDASGQRNGALTLVRDIGEAKRAARMKSEFVSVVSHELRTPLTSIRGSLGLVVGGAGGELPAKARHLLEIAYRNTDRLTLLINDILDIDKIESGKTQFEIRTTLLAPLLEQAIEANAAYAASCDVQLHLHHPIPSAFVRVDANRLLQVMANLLSNAAKFSPRGATVDVTVTTSATHARVCVRDDGPGIPVQFRPQVFQKFSQADGSDSRSKPGTGLGLAISKALIERMDGTIGFESQPGCGALFFFELPLVSGVTVAAG